MLLALENSSDSDYSAEDRINSMVKLLRKLSQEKIQNDQGDRISSHCEYTHMDTMEDIHFSQASSGSSVDSEDAHPSPSRSHFGSQETAATTDSFYTESKQVRLQDIERVVSELLFDNVRVEEPFEKYEEGQESEEDEEDEEDKEDE